MSLFSGIEAATQAWRDLGWEPAAFAEIEPFPAAVLTHHYPNVPNLGDVTKHKEWPDIGPVDLICGGSPCQSFSVAGLRKGMDDPRGNLMLTYLAIVDQYRPAWVVYENVPGILSSNGGRDFGALLGALGQLGYGFAYRVLDAQYVRTRRSRRAVPQRRRRVFVVGYSGDWRRAAAVLFDAESLRRDPPPRRSAGERVAPTISARPTGGGGLGTDLDGGVIAAPGNHGEHEALRRGLDLPSMPGDEQPLLGDDMRVVRPRHDGRVIAAEVSTSLDASMGRLRGASGQDANHGHSTLVAMSSGQANAEITEGHAPSLTCLHEAPIIVQGVAPTLRGRGFDTTNDGTGKGTPIIPVAFNSREDPEVTGDRAGPLGSSLPQAQAVAYSIQAGALRENPDAGPDGVGVQEGHAYTLEARAEVQAIAFQDRTRGDDGRGYDRPPPISEEVIGTLETVKRWNVALPWAVRRLTPVECERLMDFPDGFTAIPWRKKPASACPDGPRYKALGNSWAVNVAEWVGERIAIVDAWPENEARAARPTNGDPHAESQ